MTRRDPARRPTAAGALQQWKSLRRGVWTVKRFWRPRPRGEHLVVKAFSDIFSLASLSPVSTHLETLTPNHTAISCLQVPTLVLMMGSNSRSRS